MTSNQAFLVGAEFSDFSQTTFVVSVPSGSSTDTILSAGNTLANAIKPTGQSVVNCWLCRRLGPGYLA